jgi:aspartyl-tRNA(Asn)/glutamyl-tRNA(Gln) amidotransferase subunit A
MTANSVRPGPFVGSWSVGGRLVGPPLSVELPSCDRPSIGLVAARAAIDSHASLNAIVSLNAADGPAVEVIAVKDNIDVRGLPTSGGSALMPLSPAVTDADVVVRARAHGAFVVAKTNLHQWAIGPTGLVSLGGPVRNPRDERRVAGGSSGGSASAVATGMCDWAIGTDTGGSVRIPASLCGVVGYKPTFGLLSTAGVIPGSETLDTIGALANDVATAAHAVDVMAGIDLTSGLDRYPGELRLAVPDGWVRDLDDQTQAVWHCVTEGIPRIAFPPRDRFAAAQATIARVELAANHREFIREHEDTYDPVVLRHLRDRADTLAVDYLLALRERLRIRAEVERAMDGWDAILLPGTSCVAPEIHGTVDSPELWNRLTCYTRPFNLTGHPVLVIPGPSTGLPVGIQVIGQLNRERELVRAAFELEAVWTELSAG